MRLNSNNGRPLVLDGAMGSVLQLSLVHKLKSWTTILNLEQPEIIIDLHKKYIEASANIITTNTFRTNPTALKNNDFGLISSDIIKKTVELAKNAIGDKSEIIVAGSNAPAEDCYQVERNISFMELEENHKLHIEQLWNSGCDIIWNETQSHLDEIKIICNFCSTEDIPFVINLYFGDDLKILSGESIYKAIDLIAEYAPIAIGFNCIPPNRFDKFDLNKLPNIWGFYFNCGSGDFTDDKIECGISPEVYQNYVKKYLPHSPLFIGSCCGSNPEHTKNIRKIIDEQT